jgi:hypothetical protein
MWRLRTHVICVPVCVRSCVVSPLTPFSLSLPQGHQSSLRLRGTLGGHVKQRGTCRESDDSFIFQFPASLGGFSSNVLGAGCISKVADGHVGVAARDACHNHSA